MDLTLGTIADRKPEHSLLFAVQPLTQGRDCSSAEQHKSQRNSIWVTKVRGKSRRFLQPGMNEQLIGVDV